MNTSSNIRAFTLIEVLIAITVSIGIAVIIFLAFSSFNKTFALNAATQTVLSSLEEARTKTLASQQEAVYGVHFDSDAIVIFKGGVYDSMDSENEQKSVSSSVTIETPVLQGGGSDVIFDRLTGKTSQYGTITLSSTSESTTRIVTIEQTGIAHE